MQTFSISKYYFSDIHGYSPLINKIRKAAMVNLLFKFKNECKVLREKKQ